MPIYDPAARRRALRKTKRERGVWIYVPAVELERIGLADAGELFYRIWTRSKTILVQFYREP